MTDNLAQWVVLDVNPYPWKVPPFSPARRGKALFVQAGRDQGLHDYKEAIREQLGAFYPWRIEGPVKLSLWFWREIQTYTTEKQREQRKHEADTTNLQKSTEDAFQGFFFDNDTDVVLVRSHRVEQAPGVRGMVVACVEPFDEPLPRFPDEVNYWIDELKNRYNFPAAPVTDSPPDDIPF